MVFCFVAIAVLGVLSIFSARYRSYFRDAWRCIWRQISLRPCDTNFDDVMKSKLSGKVLRLHPRLGRFIYRRFLLLSWIMLIVMIISLFFMAQAFYNIAVYGTCDPVSGNCIINPGLIGLNTTAHSQVGCTVNNTPIYVPV